VAATHSRTGLPHFILGSVAEHIIRKAPCPVLVVRQPADETAAAAAPPRPLQFGRILVPIDFSELSLGALAWAARFAEELGGHLTVLHIEEPGGRVGTVDGPILRSQGMAEAALQSAQGRMDEAVAPYAGRGLIAKAVVQRGYPLTDIAAFANRGRYDLVACATHGYSGLKRMFLGSVAESLIRHAQAPLLVFSRAALQMSAAPKPSFTRVPIDAAPGTPIDREAETTRPSSYAAPL
jgi:nucleotide-binding universal stress UspA family protein